MLLKQEAESTNEHEKVRLRHNIETLTEAVGSLASYELLQIKIKKMAEDL